LSDDDHITGDALQWHAALAQDDADWDAFTTWLEADPRHRSAYDEIARIDQALDSHREALAAVLPPESAPRRHVARWWGGGIAAGLAAAAAAALLLVPGAPSSVRSYETGPGQIRAVALADGGRVQLAAASRLTVLPDNRLRLSGAATFDVPHRPERTLTIEAGGVTVSDIGTTFEIADDGGVVRVAVAEGRVQVGGPGFATPIAVAGGRRLTVDPAHGVVQQGPLREFAAWRQGRLVYENAPLPVVADEIGRYAGIKVTLAPGLADRRFSGVLTAGDNVVDDLARFMDVEARREPSGVRLVPRAGGRR
jgi:transmembrane sensor